MKLRAVFGTRRDMCHLIGKRAGMLSHHDAAFAWLQMAGDLEAMAELDVPKFNDLICLIRSKTIAAKGRHWIEAKGEK